MNIDSATFEGLWKQLPRATRTGWLTAAYARYFAFIGLWRQKESGTIVELDGRCIDGLDAFFCAIGEAVNGPAGYFGKNLNGFADCAMGGFGITPPWILRWHYSEVARKALGYEETLRHERELYNHGDSLDDEARTAGMAKIEELSNGLGPTLFDAIIEILNERGIAVELL
ncbi:MAG TPA: barstar family protein [Polyangium sp.]|nr:barstar family protein [Polyangium sp.]